MLAQACIELARRCTILTSVARTRRSLEKLDSAVRGAGCTHHMLALDWSSSAEYLDALGAHVRRIGSPSLTLAAAGSRWLTNAEISSGVLAAVDRPARVTVLGTVEPWQLRPRP